MDDFLQDLRFAMRSLRKSKLIVAAAVVSLGLGIGATSAIFSAVDVFMLRPLPYPDSHDLLAVYTTNLERGWDQVSFSVPDFVDFRERGRAIDVAASRWASFNLSEGERPERVEGQRLTWNFLRVLGVEPELVGFVPVVGLGRDVHDHGGLRTDPLEAVVHVRRDHDEVRADEGWLVFPPEWSLLYRDSRLV